MRDALEDQSFEREVFKQKFDQLNKNYFEPEFEPSPDNSYVKIYDENLPGAERFMGILPEGCLYDE